MACRRGVPDDLAGMRSTGQAGPSSPAPVPTQGPTQDRDLEPAAGDHSRDGFESTSQTPHKAKRRATSILVPACVTADRLGCAELQSSVAAYQHMSLLRKASSLAADGSALALGFQGQPPTRRSSLAIAQVLAASSCSVITRTHDTLAVASHPCCTSLVCCLANGLESC